MPRLQRFLLKNASIEGVDRDALRKGLMDHVESADAAPLYEHLCRELGWQRDVALAERLKKKNEERLKELADKLKDAEENLGDIEVREAMLAKADYLASIGDMTGALKAYDETGKPCCASPDPERTSQPQSFFYYQDLAKRWAAALDPFRYGPRAEAKTVALGQKLDLTFSTLRLGIAFEDWHLVKSRLTKSSKVFEEGADWERKNRLKVYEAVFHMATRNFKQAAELLQASVATFTCTELMSYEQCIAYCVLMAIVALDRPRLKKSVIDSPEVLSVMPKLPHLRDFLNSFYSCDYRPFFQVRPCSGVLRRPTSLALRSSCRASFTRPFLEPSSPLATAHAPLVPTPAGPDSGCR